MIAERACVMANGSTPWHRWLESKNKEDGEKIWQWNAELSDIYKEERYEKCKKEREDMHT